MPEILREFKVEVDGYTRNLKDSLINSDSFFMDVISNELTEKYIPEESQKFMDNIYQQRCEIQTLRKEIETLKKIN